MDEDVFPIDEMLPTTISKGGNHYNSYDDFVFFDTQEEHEKLTRRNIVQRSHCQNQLYFYQKYFHKANSYCDGIGGYRGLVGRANVGNRENSHISVSENEV
jgi:hypothetical protein